MTGINTNSMTEPKRNRLILPPEQRAIRDKCCHPSGTFVAFPKESIASSIPARFEHIVAGHHDRLAVKSGDCSMTYGELDRRSNRIATAILNAVGEIQEPVAVLCRHDAPVVAAILGILKAGKFYLPMDADWPQPRAATILESSETRLILTDNTHLPFTATLARSPGHILNIESLERNLSTDHLELSLSPQSCAYVIYTSGSTGEPKGVLQNHRNVLHSVLDNTNSLRLCPEDRLTGLYQYYTNGGAHDIFTALLNGAALFPFAVKRWGLPAIPGWLNREAITIYHSVRSVFRQFALFLRGDETLPSLRAISLGGENVTKIDVDLFKKYFPDRSIFVNRLGSTECGRISRYFIDKSTIIDAPNVPVGYPSPDYEIEIADESGTPLAENRIGEIIVKSEFLSPGYWRRPDLTQEKFDQGPVGGRQRLYRTGDLGRFRADGCLECVGRKDFEVKIGGNRIQTAEIELALVAYPGIKQAHVVPHQISQGEPQLVAYYKLEGTAEPKRSQLSRFLRDRLPGFMIPPVFMKIEEFPLTGNGKLDLNSLPTPSTARPDLDTEFVAAETPVERLVATIWTETLGLDRVGVYDNFLDLGGHSLTATRVVSTVMKQFQLEIPLPFLFQSPTVAEMAAVITEHKAKKPAEKVERVLSELESLSDEEAEQLLNERQREDSKS
jgi:amino acid adenylation domain-containing protein